MHKILFLFGTLFIFNSLSAQEAYRFTDILDIEATPVISQGNTGTCWSFSTSSFLESEIIRLTGKQIDLSEMFTVRNTYPKKAENYVMRQGKAQFSQGGLSHDVINSVREFGLVPQEAFSGLFAQETKHNHAEMVAVLNAMVKTYVDNPGKKLSKKWKKAINAVLNVYLGNNVKSFNYKGKQYTPKSFSEFTKIKPENYISLTSFSHEPFYSEFILNIPDNWSYGSFYNITINEMVETINHALENGFTVALDCDVSERTFSSKDGIAVIPSNSLNNIKSLQGIYPEKNITQEYRQEEFENFDTTDDHLMHITGLVKDQNDKVYYKVKNSWGNDSERTANGGYVYFSEAYIKLKTISVMVHKDALPKMIGEKLNLK